MLPAQGHRNPGGRERQKFATVLLQHGRNLDSIVRFILSYHACVDGRAGNKIDQVRLLQPIPLIRPQHRATGFGNLFGTHRLRPDFFRVCGIY